MANKFGKFVLFTAAVSAAGAVTYYFLQKRDSQLMNGENDEDYDDFSGEQSDTASRTYVPLNHDSSAEPEQEEVSSAADNFTPLSEQAPQASEAINDKTEETIEDFFDEADPEDE